MVIWDKGLLLERNEEASLYPTGHELKKWAIPKKSNGEVDFDLCVSYHFKVVFGNSAEYFNLFTFVRFRKNVRLIFSRKLSFMDRLLFNGRNY